ncbi:protein of unknown function [Vibrio tapetis subsp. tapetis]|uniref:Uncharacterized protein n=1 Tax=Vibrio tapetis subsp. tapetis TaxID=1671868 RepID=A0A2N8ZAN7_9VIBR|nr:protein of unknown function [Vibrio tapetis subsp. tapetis]
MTLGSTTFVTDSANTKSTILGRAGAGLGAVATSTGSGPSGSIRVSGC